MPHCEDFSPVGARLLALDTATDRIGEIMRVSHEGDKPVQVWLRPVDGGCEWTTKPEYIQRIKRVPQDGEGISW